MKADLLKAIESPDLSAQVNVVSGYKQFINAIESLPAVKQLEREVRTTDDSIKLLIRIAELVNAEHDQAYETPYDVALACYLWVLSIANPGIARIGAKRVQSCYGCWWSRQLAEKLLAAREAAPRIQSSGTVLTRGGPVKTRTNNSTDVGFLYIEPAPGSAVPGGWNHMSMSDLLTGGRPMRNVGGGLSLSDLPERNRGTGDELQVVEEVA